MPIFDFNDVTYRNVLKLAPDAFVVFNGAFGSKIVSPLNKEGYQSINPMGGVTSINVSNSVQAGTGRATLQIVAPKYKGIHEDYYVTMPSGVRVPYFLPLMEVKIYMKGRFLAGNSQEPVYYPVFWGLITDISQDYNDGVDSFSLTCGDILTWWKYQKITTNPSVFTAIFGGPKIQNFPTVFKNKNPWQIIMTLIYDTEFSDRSGKSTFNFVSPSFSSSMLPPDYGGVPLSQVGALSVRMNKYWSDRFTFNGEVMALEMYGLTSQVSPKGLDSLKQTTFNGIDMAQSKLYNEGVPAELKLDYNLLAKVQPFGDLGLFGDGAQAVEMTKLDIALKVTDMVHMEFFLDMNGILVFKPPFYNMDVTQADVPYYVIEPSDVIDFSSQVTSDGIVTFMEVSGPQSQIVTDLRVSGFHIDWDLMLRYGMRHQDVFVQYGSDAKLLRLIAAAEMAKVNGRATSGSVTIPLRPEMRLGYPVYLPHDDVYYYVEGISHSFSFGSSATTSLSMNMRRDRLYSPLKLDENGSYLESGSGEVLDGRVWRFNATKDPDNFFKEVGRREARRRAEAQQDIDKPSTKEEMEEKEKYKRYAEVIVGPRFNGFYEVSKAKRSNKTVPGIVNQTGKNATYLTDELVMITKDTIPYTDTRGYRHIGAFPYGANLRLSNNTDIIDITEPNNAFDERIRQRLSGVENQNAPRKSNPEKPFETQPPNEQNEKEKNDQALRGRLADNRR